MHSFTNYIPNLVRRSHGFKRKQRFSSSVQSINVDEIVRNPTRRADRFWGLVGVKMAMSLKGGSFLQLNKADGRYPFWIPARRSVVSTRSARPVAALASGTAVGVSETFSRLKEQGKVAFIPYITAGDPDLSTTAQALKILDKSGADIIELGVPYSDPLADGPVIQAASTRALAKGTNLDAILNTLNTVVPQLSCPVALFSYYNPILKRWIGNFMTTIKDVGVHGLVVPDVPLEETENLRKEAVKNSIELVLLTTPTTPKERMRAIVDAAEGFVYLVSTVGVTGARASVSGTVENLLKQIKEASDKPVAVGFGISKPEHVKQVVGLGADGVIVGSAMVKLLAEAKSPEEGLEELESFTKTLTSAL